MIDAKLHDEAGRLAALRRLGVIGRPDDGRFDHVAVLVRALLGVPIATVSFVDAAVQELWSGEGLPACSTERRHSFCQHTIQQVETFVVPDATRDPRFCDLPFVVGEPHVRPYAGAPIVMPDGYQIGALCGYDVKPRAFSPESLAALGALVTCVVRELELGQQAADDELTGLKRRGAFFANVEQAVDAGDPGAALGILDLDRFKGINDRFGHQAGDAVLRAVGALLRLETCGGAVAGRIGGEEFAVLLRSAECDDPHNRFEAIREAVGMLQVPEIDGESVTTSIGWSPLRPGIADPTGWYRLADAALFAAKNAGRNRAIMAEEDAVHRPERTPGTLPHLHLSTAGPRPARRTFRDAETA